MIRGRAADGALRSAPLLGRGAPVRYDFLAAFAPLCTRFLYAALLRYLLRSAYAASRQFSRVYNNCAFISSLVQFNYVKNNAMIHTRLCSAGLCGIQASSVLLFPEEGAADLGLEPACSRSAVLARHQVDDDDVELAEAPLLPLFVDWPPERI